MNRLARLLRDFNAVLDELLEESVLTSEEVDALQLLATRLKEFPNV